MQAQSIQTHEKTYINEAFSWNHTIDDLLSIAYFALKDYSKSLEHIEKAISLCTDSIELKRLQKNKEIIGHYLSQWPFFEDIYNYSKYSFFIY